MNNWTVKELRIGDEKIWDKQDLCRKVAETK